MPMKAMKKAAAKAVRNPVYFDKKDHDNSKDEDEEDDDVTILEPLHAVKALLFSESLADVYFRVGKAGGKSERIPAHRLILSAGNPVFRAILYPLAFAADSKSATYTAARPAAAVGDSDEMVIDDVAPASFKKMLTAIYTDDAEVTAEDVAELIVLSKRFGVDSLRSLCVEFMERDVTADKACVLFVEGRKLLNEPAFGLSFIEENIEDIAKTEGFNDLPADCLDTILRSNKLAIDEGDLWVAVDKWAMAQCLRDKKIPDGPNKRAVLGGMLQLIRFPVIEMSELCVKVQPSMVLTQEELLSLFTYCAAPEESKPNTTFSTRERDGGGGGKVQIHEFNWSQTLSNSARVRANGSTLSSQAPTCNRDVLGIADMKGWARGVHYWRINTANGGCYLRVGVVDGDFDRSKYGDGGPQHGMPCVLGATPKSWGVNVSSAHNFGEPNVFSGACGRFTAGEVGVLLDLNKKKLHVFANGQFVATAFTNVTGKKLRPAVEICHSGSSVNVVPARGTVAPAVPK